MARTANRTNAPGGARRAFAALDSKTFRWWFFSQVLSASGTMTQGVAQAWLVLRLTNNGIDLGAITACTFGPMLLAGPWAGSLVDRHSRRSMLLFTQTAFVVVSGTLGVLTVLGDDRLWMLYAAALLTGCVAALDSPARQVFVLELVGSERTANAVSLNEVVINISRVLGPAAGGLLLALTGAGGCFLLNAASFLPPLAVLLWPRTKQVLAARAAAASHAARRPTRRGDAMAGLRYVWHERPIRAVVVLAAMAGTLFSLGVALPLLATRTFHEGSAGFGLMMAAFGMGALFGAFAAARGDPWPAGRQVRTLAAATAVLVVATAAAPDLALVFIGLALSGAASIWFIARANALAQLRAAPEMRGRVMAIWSMALPGTNPMTGLLTGVVAQALGAREGFGLAGVLIAIGTLTGWRALADHGHGDAAAPPPERDGLPHDVGTLPVAGPLAPGEELSGEHAGSLGAGSERRR